MKKCPRCPHSLSVEYLGPILAWGCVQGHGYSVGWADLHENSPEAFLRWLKQGLELNRGVTGAKCSHCSQDMKQLQRVEKGKRFSVDVCEGCHHVWLDAGELEMLLQHKVPLEKQSSRVSPEFANTIDWRDEDWATESYSPGLFSGYFARYSFSNWPAAFWRRGYSRPQNHLHDPLPTIDHEGHGAIKIFPTLTVILLFLMFLGTIVSVSTRLKWAFIPAEAFRFWGTTFITSAFVHADWLHFGWNAYFLWIFGEQIEDKAGHEKFTAFCIFSMIAVNVGIFFLHGRSNAAYIGASALVYALMLYFACHYPKARIAFWSQNWIDLSLMKIALPIWIFICAKLGIDFAFLENQFKGLSRTGHSAHILGALIGILAALFYPLKHSKVRKVTAELE